MKRLALLVTLAAGMPLILAAGPEAEPRDASRESPTSETDRNAVERLFTREFARLWRAGDAAGLARLWREDGDWMGLLGSRRVQRGRDAVEGVWRIGLDGRETAWHRALEVRVDELRALADGLYQVELTLAFGSPATGVIREAMSATVARDGEDWRVVTARVARLSAEPPSVPEAQPARAVERTWSLGPEAFCEPETVVWDPVRTVYVVSNVCGFAANGRGYLSRIAADGELLTARWVEGLDAPAGMAVADDRLWVVDLSVLREISLEDGRQLSRIELPAGARAPNDVAAFDGVLFVTDSARNAVYRAAAGEAEVWLRDERLRWANGIHAEAGRLWVGGETVRAIELESGRIGPPLGPVSLTDVDGIEADGAGGLVFSLVGGPVVHWSADGRARVFTAEGLSSANLLYRPEAGLAVIPQGTDGGVVALTLPPADD